MWLLFALGVAKLAAEGSPPPVVVIQSQPVYVDLSQGIEVDYIELPSGEVLFSSRLPVNAGFTIDIDGDKNGKWGVVSGLPEESVVTSPDHSYGQDVRGGVFCSQYILSSYQGEPTKKYVSSECGGLKSDGRAVMSGFDENMRFAVQYFVPAGEFFGGSNSARIQVCVWLQHRNTCQHQLPNLLEIVRNGEGHAP